MLEERADNVLIVTPTATEAEAAATEHGWEYGTWLLVVQNIAILGEGRLPQDYYADPNTICLAGTQSRGKRWLGWPPTGTM